MKKIFVLILDLICLAAAAQSPDSLSVADSLYIDEPRPSDVSTGIFNFVKGSGAPVDTLDVADGRIMVVLCDDNTWYLVKNMEKQASDEVFTDHWVVNSVNPYVNVPYDSLHYRNTICLVDSVSRFVCPHKGKVFSRFGYRRHRNHMGVDVPYPTGTPVYAAFDGRVRASLYSKGYGNLVIIRHSNGLETYYGHLSQRDLEPGQWVHAGDRVGLGGSTGRSTGPHLHFETRYQGYAFDPEWIVDFENGTLRRNVFVLKRHFLSPASRYVPETVDDEEELYMTEEQIKAEEERIARERAAMKWHTVKQGDTLGHIAIKYHTSVSKICNLNSGLTPKTTLKLGRKIRVN